VSRRNEACLSDSGRRRCMAAAPLCMRCGRPGLEDERRGEAVCVERASFELSDIRVTDARAVTR
jgi:hypothetical protein